MEHLWSPWRYRYVTTERTGAGCIFCTVAAAGQDEENLIVYRGRHNFIVLNRFPYTSGHLMIVPYAHVDSLESASTEILQEMILLAQRAQRHLREIYNPDGLNLGMNLGESAGAGIAGHIHLHVLPRWSGDTSFMTAVAETRVLPEDLPATYCKLSEAFRQNG
ncbi:MAG TPA: HIT domain-containing protein [Bryobacteraceae bacterium]|nr:HIT domain-containing protein [Bryobacteraceae bacterium]